MSVSPHVLNNVRKKLKIKYPSLRPFGEIKLMYRNGNNFTIKFYWKKVLGSLRHT